MVADHAACSTGVSGIQKFSFKEAFQYSLDCLVLRYIFFGSEIEGLQRMSDEVRLKGKHCF
jgi:hypothetical protein